MRMLEVTELGNRIDRVPFQNQNVPKGVGSQHAPKRLRCADPGGDRATLLDQLQQWHDRGITFAVLFFDLDRFKEIKYGLGENAATSLLEMAADRVRHCLQAEDVLAWLGADEFAVGLPRHQPQGAAVCAAERIRGALSQPFRIAGQEIRARARIGIALNAPEDRDPAALLDRASMAAYGASFDGNIPYRMFDRELRDRTTARFEIETELRQAIVRDELQAYYQPIVNLQTGAIVGFEALTRWIHPQRGAVPPDEFVSVAESTGSIAALEMQMLRQTCQQLRSWQQQFGDLSLSVNISVQHLCCPGMVDGIARIVTETGIAPGSLKLEITEGLLMEDAPTLVAVLEGLRSLGIQLYADDFGTGYSSLGYLRRFPIDAIKIDRSFINGIAERARYGALVRSILTLAANLGMPAIAEGIETAAELERLRSWGCPYGQGYLFSRPVDRMAATDLLQQAPRW